MILRVVVYFLLLRLFITDLASAHDGWGWMTVASEIVIGVLLALDHVRERKLA